MKRSDLLREVLGVRLAEVADLSTILIQTRGRAILLRLPYRYGDGRRLTIGEEGAHLLEIARHGPHSVRANIIDYQLYDRWTINKLRYNNLIEVGAKREKDGYIDIDVAPGKCYDDTRAVGVLLGGFHLGPLGGVYLPITDVFFKRR